MSRIRIVDITLKPSSKYLYKCLAPIPFRKYRKRLEYLKNAVPRGFHKKILLFGGRVVGQIEYAPSEASGYPISGENIVVVNCIWVLRKAKGHGFGKLLLNSMIKSEKNASGFATIGLEGYWSPWFRREHMERLGFKSVDSIRVRHAVKHTGQCFKIHLMWFPIVENASPPKWDKQRLLRGVSFCLAHPLYNPERLGIKEILRKT
ncbi:MAG: GNAT family N-acetyltransferase [Candidatus Brockarchaeota archaeon]|nr:GNAT family N-acetyltransferase [Candidatus Brockarchaeota archaeon]